MSVNGINSTNAFANFKSPVTSRPSQTNIPENTGTIKESNKTDKTRQYIKYGAGLFLLSILIFAGKNIISKLKNIKKTKVDIPDQSVKVQEENPVVIERIKIPEKENVIKNTDEIPNKINTNDFIADENQFISKYREKTLKLQEYEKAHTGKPLTDEEENVLKEIRAEYKSVIDEGVEKNYNFIDRKTSSDFETKEEQYKYLMSEVRPNMSKNEASALTGLEIFEDLGYRGTYKNSVTYTLSLISTSMRSLPNKYKTEKVLNKFLDVMEKFAKPDTVFMDNAHIASVITDFAKPEFEQKISTKTIIKGIDLVKKLTNQKVDYSRLNYALITQYRAKYASDTEVLKSLDSLKQVVKDLPEHAQRTEG